MGVQINVSEIFEVEIAPYGTLNLPGPSGTRPAQSIPTPPIPSPTPVPSTLENIRPFPKAGPRKQTTRKSRKRVSTVWADTPNKHQLENEKKRKVR